MKLKSLQHFTNIYCQCKLKRNQGRITDEEVNILLELYSKYENELDFLISELYNETDKDIKSIIINGLSLLKEKEELDKEVRFDNMNYLSLTQDFCDFMINNKNCTGVYKIHFKDKVIYIGKGTNSISDRSFESLKARIPQLNAFTPEYIAENTYISHCVIQNKQDIHVMELYLIGKEKPLLNKDCKEESFLTIDINHNYAFSDPVKCFEIRVKSKEESQFYKSYIETNEYLKSIKN